MPARRRRTLRSRGRPGAYLLDRQLRPGAQAALFASITDGTLRVEDLGQPDRERIGELVTTYADLRHCRGRGERAARGPASFVLIRSNPEEAPYVGFGI
jgi:hypothetical protein